MQSWSSRLETCSELPGACQVTGAGRSSSPRCSTRQNQNSLSAAISLASKTMTH